MFKKLRLAEGVLLASLCLAMMGCSSQQDSDSSSMGSMPTAPPAGYAPAKSDVSPDAFVAKLESLPRSDRPQYIKDNQAAMNEVMSGPDDSPAKKKLQAIISEH